MRKLKHKQRNRQQALSSRQRRRNAVALERSSSAPSQPATRALSPFPALPGDRAGLALLESHDTFADARNTLRRIAEKAGIWAGIPMFLQDQKIHIEPTWPTRDEFLAIVQKATPEEEARDAAYEALTKDVTIRNEFWSHARRGMVTVYEIAGKIRWEITSRPHYGSMELGTIGASYAWGIEQEANAVNTLAGLLSHHRFKQYMLTGMFLEKSKRSGVMYMFRRLKPTIALTFNPGFRGGKSDQARILAALCLHPIGYYENSFAGAMCPTDDVIAHLMLCRGDEHMFWKRANQHPPYKPEAGLG